MGLSFIVTILLKLLYWNTLGIPPDGGHFAKLVHWWYSVHSDYWVDILPYVTCEQTTCRHTNSNTTDVCIVMISQNVLIIESLNYKPLNGMNGWRFRNIKPLLSPSSTLYTSFARSATSVLWVISFLCVMYNDWAALSLRRLETVLSLCITLTNDTTRPKDTSRPTETLKKYIEVSAFYWNKWRVKWRVKSEVGVNDYNTGCLVIVVVMCTP